MQTKTLIACGVSILLSSSEAVAVVLCAKPRSDGTYNTSVKIREACKDNETQLDAAQIGVQGEQGPEGAQGPQGEPGQPNSFVVVDANDVVLGPLVSSSAPHQGGDAAPEVSQMPTEPAPRVGAP